MKYPLFKPSIDFASKPPRDWSKLEADNYFDWFLNVFESRVHSFLIFLNLDYSLEDRTLLKKAQDECEKLLITGYFSQILPTGPKLNNQGYALAADFGLLVASLLIKQGQGKVNWKILKKPKSELSYNLPVLVGFGSMHLDPIAGSIAEMNWLLKGNENKDAWFKIFEYYLNKTT